MKTFLPIISPTGNPWHTMRLSLESLDNKRLGKQRVESYQIWRTITGLNQTKSWRTSPAIHMWRGYPDALGVYIAVNCALWARRRSATTGRPFSNAKMDEHIKTFGFGRNSQGRIVYELEPEQMPDERKEDEGQLVGDASASFSSQLESSQDLAIDSQLVEEFAAEAPPAVAAAAEAALSDSPVAAAAAASSSSSAAASDSSASAAARPGRHVDGIRVPWWFHDERVHHSDAGVLYSKDPKFYAAFKPFHEQFPEYVWPRDIEPHHPEQAMELDELQRVLDAEKEEKEAKKAAGSKRNKRKQRPDDEVEEEEAKESSESGESEESVEVKDEDTESPARSRPRARRATSAPAADARVQAMATPQKRRRSTRPSPSEDGSEAQEAGSVRAKPERQALPRVKIEGKLPTAAAAPTSASTITPLRDRSAKRRREVDLDVERGDKKIQPAAAAADGTAAGNDAARRQSSRANRTLNMM